MNPNNSLSLSLYTNSRDLGCAVVHSRHRALNRSDRGFETTTRSRPLLFSSSTSKSVFSSILGFLPFISFVIPSVSPIFSLLHALAIPLISNSFEAPETICSFFFLCIRWILLRFIFFTSWCVWSSISRPISPSCDFEFELVSVSIWD